MKVKGFTLIDLITTLAIASIIIFQAVPGFANMLSHYRSEAVVHNLIGLISVARHGAISSGQLTTFCGSTDGRNCDRGWNEGILVFTDRGEMGVVDNEDKVIRYSQVMEDGNITWRAFQNKGYLQFQSNGFTNYHNGSLRYCPANLDARYARQIILNVGGRVRMAQDLDENEVPNGADGTDISC